MAKKRIGGRVVYIRKDGTYKGMENDTKRDAQKGSLDGLASETVEDTRINYTSISSEIIKKHGFSGTNELVDYVNNQYWAKETSALRKEKAFSIEDAPWGGNNTALLTQGNRTETASFVDYLKRNLNVYVESYGNGSWFIHMSKDADGLKKRKRPKEKR